LRLIVSESQKGRGGEGDKPTEPLELIVRRIDGGRELLEEVGFRMGHSQLIDPQLDRETS
jgi:hypothetical protein